MRGVNAAPTMISRHPGSRCLLPALGALVLALPIPLRAAWQAAPDSLAWREGTHVLWQFNSNPTQGKPFFHPVSARGGGVLTQAHPEDHPWHYGLWFSWKYLNGVNYWEQDRQTGKAEGATRWSTPIVQTNNEGSATIGFDLKYVHPSGRVELTEQRQLVISAPDADGGYTVDWTATFRTGTNSVKFDRTPMPGEPNGQVNGGYAGLSLRMAAAPVEIALVTEHGPVTEFASNRARPEARALACNQSREGNGLGGVAILSHPANLKDRSPWYAVVSDSMRFYCSAILAPAPLTLGPEETLKLRYRIIVRRAAWTRDDLGEVLREWQ
jgi:hypothetical protein